MGMTELCKIWSVYVMAAPDKAGHTFFKVGRSSDIAKRLGQVQTGCPLKISKVWALTLWGNGASQRLEAGLHERLRPYHSHGEWFRMDTANAEHKRDMNAALEYGRKFASQMHDVRWREVDVTELRRAIAEHERERSDARRVSRERRLQKAVVLMASTKRRIM